MKEVKLYIFNDPSQKGKGAGLNESVELSFTQTDTLTSEPDSDDSVSTTTMTSTSKATVGLLKLAYIKKMYKPGVIFATLSVSSIKSDPPVIKTEKKDKNGNVVSTSEDVGHATGLGPSKENIYRLLKQLLLNAKAELMIDGKVVATNYFVYKVRSVHKQNMGSGVTVELTIFSEDKLLTLEKYSKAYTAKKLGSDIFKGEIGNYNLTGDETNPAYSINLQLLTYDNDKSEFRQPYLVQYNESLYDFLKRTANRCGEFLYHEDGKLHLGVALNRLDLDTTDEKGNITATAIDYAEVAQECYYESLYDGEVFKDDVSVEDYAYNYLDNTDKDAEHHAKSDNGKFHYNDPLTTDEYLGDIGMNYTSYGNEWDEIEKIAMSQILLALTGTSFSEIIDNFALAMASNAVEAAVNEGSKNGDNKEANITPWMDKDDEDKVKAGTEDQWNGTETLRQFGTYGDKITRISETGINMTAKFYSLVRKAERKVGEEAVWLEFGEDAQNLKLGDVIKVAGTSYLVVRISGKYEYVSGTKTTMTQEVVAIPLYATSSTTTNVIAIPWALPEVTVREAHPQLAFVVENLDPKKIGRVRIRFAWQEKDADASPWIRVALPFATNGGGIKFKPEKGDEVLVNFEDGNIERPYVSGYLLSERSNETWGSLSDRVIMSKNGHGITFTDGPGSDFFYNWLGITKALKSWFPTSVWPDSLEDKASCAALSGGIKLRDQYGLYEISASSDERTVKIESAMGDVTLNAFTGITVSAPNGNIKIAGKNIEIAASNTLKLSSGSALKNRFFPDSARGGISLKSFGSVAAKTAMDTFLGLGKGFIGNIVDKFLDLTLIRTVLEVVLRPIDGTTSIKSCTFLEIQAGKGSVEMPPERAIKTGQLNTFPDIRYTLEAIANTVGTQVDIINTAATKLAEKLKNYKNMSGDKDDMINKSQGAIGLDAVKGNGWKAKADQFQVDNTALKWDVVGLKDEELVKKDDAIKRANEEIKKITGNAAEPKEDDKRYQKDSNGNKSQWNYKDEHDKWEEYYKKFYTTANEAINIRNSERKDKREKLVSCVNDLASAFSSVFNAFADVDNLTTLVSTGQTTITDDNKDKAIASIKEYGKFIGVNDHKLFDALANNKVDINTDFTQGIGDDVKKLWRRKAIIDYLGKVCATVNSAFSGDTVMIASPAPFDVRNEILWGAGIDAMFTEKQLSTGADLLKHLKDTTIQEVKDWGKDDIWHPLKAFGYSVVGKHRWKTGVHGKILMSDSPSMTISFDRDGNPIRQVNAVASDKSIFELRDFIKSL